jgi:hypothetical protein
MIRLYGCLTKLIKEARNKGRDAESAYGKEKSGEKLDARCDIVLWYKYIV